MKKALFALIGIAATASATIVAVKWQNHARRSSASIPATQAPAPNVNPATPTDTSPAEPQLYDQTVIDSPGDSPNNFTASPPAATTPPAPAAKSSVIAGLSQPLQILVWPQSTFAQRQAAWKELHDTHQLDKAIAELEHAVAAEPSGAEYSATLGQAYVQKLQTLNDFREQSILAIKADQSFDQALKVDSSSWDARYWKALSLSYWPAELNKSAEVIDNLVTLVEQQETLPPQTHFAQAYVLLGDQYLKAGYTDDAKAIWQRGASKFPGNDTLRDKLASLQ